MPDLPHREVPGFQFVSSRTAEDILREKRERTRLPFWVVAAIAFTGIAVLGFWFGMWMADKLKGM